MFRTASSCLLLLSLACSAAETEIRQPAVAGRFYPADGTRLRLAVQKYLETAVQPVEDEAIAIVAPHAGYVFSGQIAADAWAQVRSHGVDVIAVLGANHVPPGLKGVSVWAKGAFRTPLGTVSVDAEAAARLLANCRDCTTDVSMQRAEHSVEVQLPWAQVLFPNAKIVPAVLGRPDVEMCRRFGKALAKALQGRRALIVASSDLSHYPTYRDAVAADRETLRSIARMDEEAFALYCRRTPGTALKLDTSACGESPVLAAMAAARVLGAERGVVVSYANSGDTPLGDRERVVGYGAVALVRGRKAPSEPATPGAEARAGSLSAADRKILLAVARETLARFFSTETVPLVRGLSPALEVPRGAFVTLRKDGRLRGCIGHFDADTPLCRIVPKMALEAAFNDSRFPRLAGSELSQVDIEISVLTGPAAITDASQIRVGLDGVILQKDGRAATFLPQVAAEFGWGRDEMLGQLCRKAGLDAGCWKQGARFKTYQAEVFSER